MRNATTNATAMLAMHMLNSTRGSRTGAFPSAIEIADKTPTQNAFFAATAGMHAATEASIDSSTTSAWSTAKAFVDGNTSVHTAWINQAESPEERERAADSFKSNVRGDVQLIHDALERTIAASDRRKQQSQDRLRETQQSDNNALQDLAFVISAGVSLLGFALALKGHG